jgi:hypothetical protein
MQGMERSCHASVDLLVDLCADYAFGDSEIEIGLKSEPKLGRNTEVFAQSQRGVSSDSSFPIHNSADAAGWNSDFPGESIDADVHWLHELLEKNLSGMDRVKQFLVRHKSSLMIVDDLDVVSVAIFPNEANAPLIINSNAMLTLAFASQRFQAIARGSQQVLQRSRTMEVQQLPARDSLKGPKAGNLQVSE